MERDTVQRSGRYRRGHACTEEGRKYDDNTIEDSCSTEQVDTSPQRGLLEDGQTTALRAL